MVFRGVDFYARLQWYIFSGILNDNDSDTMEVGSNNIN